jgi:hypothetical protein
MFKQLLKRLDALIALLKEEKEYRDSKRQEEWENEYVKTMAEKNKKPEEIIRGSGMPLEPRTRGELIPFGLSDKDRQLLDDFYNQ